MLDVGFGQGLAMEQFRTLGLKAVGITLGSNAAVCRRKEFAVYEMDQSFMEFEDGSFDFLWCRHVLERSVAPLSTLSEYRRVVKPNGLVLCRGPGPRHLGAPRAKPQPLQRSAGIVLVNLFARTGFAVKRNNRLRFTVPCGPEMYWSFLLRRRG